MDKVKDFIERFFEDEVEAFFREKIPDLEAYNNAVRKVYTHIINSMNGSLNIKVQSELRNARFYKRHKNPSRNNPRYLYKISHYEHDKYKDVWIAYCSQPKPSLTYKAFSNALFIIEEEGGLRIAKEYYYDNYTSGGQEYKWEAVHGYEDLTFGSLEKLAGMERYLEPEDNEEYMKMYLEEK